MGDQAASSNSPAASEGSGRERRQHPRVKGPFDGSWAGAAGNGSARLWDVSTGGCYIDSLNEQRTGEHITVQISMPEGPIAAEGTVVYSIPNQGFAVQFLDMSDSSREALAQAITRLLAEGQGS
jgi:hypothetical protein